jgi:hypothetical protein
VSGNVTAVFEVENEIPARIRLWFAKAGPKIVVGRSVFRRRSWL